MKQTVSISCDVWAEVDPKSLSPEPESAWVLVSHDGHTFMAADTTRPGGGGAGNFYEEPSNKNDDMDDKLVYSEISFLNTPTRAASMVYTDIAYEGIAPRGPLNSPKEAISYENTKPLSVPPSMAGGKRIHPAVDETAEEDYDNGDAVGSVTLASVKLASVKGGDRPRMPRPGSMYTAIDDAAMVEDDEAVYAQACLPSVRAPSSFASSSRSGAETDEPMYDAPNTTSGGGSGEIVYLEHRKASEGALARQAAEKARIAENENLYAVVDKTGTGVSSKSDGEVVYLEHRRPSEVSSEHSAAEAARLEACSTLYAVVDKTGSGPRQIGLRGDSGTTPASPPTHSRPPAATSDENDLLYATSPSAAAVPGDGSQNMYASPQDFLERPASALVPADSGVDGTVNVLSKVGEDYRVVDSQGKDHVVASNVENAVYADPDDDTHLFAAAS